jgi:hypothetical protein
MEALPKPVCYTGHDSIAAGINEFVGENARIGKTTDRVTCLPIERLHFALGVAE